MNVTSTVENPRGWRERLRRARGVNRRRRLDLLVGVAILGIALGVVLGRATATGSERRAADTLEERVVPLALDADGIWTSESGDTPPVSEALVALRQRGDSRLVEEYSADWIAAYDAALARIAGLDLPTSARPVQRQFITALTLSRDAVDVLVHAATVDDPQLRVDLTTEVGRLRRRSEQITQAARSSTSELAGSRSDLSPLPAVTSFSEGRN